MTIIIRRVLSANVSVDNIIEASINYGLLLYIGFACDDKFEDLEYYVKKVSNLRIFDGEESEVSVKDINGEILSISQFTLSANTKKGNRPSYINAMPSNKALIFYNQFNQLLEEYSGISIYAGVFGADMKISAIDDGPFTIIL